jgi:hypothetical protein
MGDEGWFWDRLPKGGCGAPLVDYDSSPEKYIKNLKLDETKLISPKRGFGSSLRELRNGESISDRTVKAQKELVYQHELLSQIKEKERLKLSEEKIKDETKLRELDEYLNTYYKGRDNVPSHMRKYMRKKERHVRRKYDKLNNKDDCDDFDVETPPIIDNKRSPFRDNKQYDVDSDDDNYSNYSSKSNRSHRGSNARRNDEERGSYHNRRDENRKYANEYKQSDYSSSNRRSREGYNGRNRDDDSDYDDIPSSNRWSENASPRKRSASRSKHKSKGGSSREGWVTQEEYNKLSDLCENLMQEQDKLLAEVRRQMEVIKELKLTLEYRKSTKGSRAIPKNNKIRDHLPKINKGVPAAVVKQNPKNFVGATRYGRKLRPSSELPNESALYNSNPYEDDLGANGLSKALRRAKGAKSSW